MPIREQHPEVVRLVEGVRGKVDMQMDLAIRFGYGEIVPWVTSSDGLTRLIAGPDRCRSGTGRVRWARTCAPSPSSPSPRTSGFRSPWSGTPPRRAAPPVDSYYAVHHTEAYWTEWAAQCTYEGQYRDAVVRSLITLKALTYEPTGGIVAAATTSLPEALGGNRNWDYRYCWLRDATLTLESLMRGGYYDEAMAWRNWLLRAVAGDVSKLQIMYGPGGERRLDEWEVDWLPGYEGSAPVRIGNAASGQFQLDVYGEVMSALYSSAQAEGVQSRAGLGPPGAADRRSSRRAGRSPTTASGRCGAPAATSPTPRSWPGWPSTGPSARSRSPDLDGPLDSGGRCATRSSPRCARRASTPTVGAFTQYYGSDQLDASLLMIPLVGFLPADDPRVVGTVEAIERELMDDGFVLRYRTSDDGAVDGLTGREGAFLACSFWLADCLPMIGRADEAEELFERLLACATIWGCCPRSTTRWPAPGGQLPPGLLPRVLGQLGLPPQRPGPAEPGGRRVAGCWWTTRSRLTTIGRMKRLGRVAVRRRSGAAR